MKNKGFTLVELMVAMAIGTVILLMVSVMLVRGTGIYREENDEVNMRNDYQIIRNQIDQAIMEAKSLVIERRNGDIIIYTGEISNTRSFETSNKTTEKVIVYYNDKNIIYMFEEYVSDYNDVDKYEGYILSNTVTSFNINLDSSCLKDEVVNGFTTQYCTNPVRVNMLIGLEQKKSNVSTTFTVNLRNRLKQVVMYTTTSGTVLSDPSVTEQIYQVK